MTDTAPEQPLNRVDALLTVLLVAVSFALYARTVVPYVLISDSAEFQVLAYQVGIAHTPGYPIYLLLAKLWTFLPFGTIAYRVNLFSGVMAALAVGGVYLATQVLARSRVAGVFAALALAVSFTFWSQAIIAEVYTSGAAFVAAIWCCLLLWYRTGNGRALLVAGVLGGLGFGVHSTIGLYAPAALIFLALNRRRWPHPWRPALTGSLVGVAAYLIAFAAVDLRAAPADIFNAAYTPTRSQWDLSAADVVNPIQRMIFIGTGVQWRSAMFAGWGGLPVRVGQYIAGFPGEFAPLTTLLIVVGLVLLLVREPTVALLFIVGLFCQWAFVFTYLIGDYYVFYIAGYVLMAILAGYAVGSVVEWLTRRLGAAGRIVPAVTLVLLLVVGIWPRFAPYRSAVVEGDVPFIGMRNFLVSRDTEAIGELVERTVTEFPDNAIVFVDWNELYTYYYHAHITHGRTDLQFVEPLPRADKRGMATSVTEFINANIGTRPILLSRPLPEMLRADYRIQPRDIGFSRFFALEKR